MRLPIRVAAAIRAQKLLEPGARVLVALSGGPDSVALLCCLLELARKRDLAFTLVAAHLQHGLRGKSADADERFCVELCRGLNVPLLRARVHTPRVALRLKRSHEESARIARHAFLAAAAQKSGCARVAVAHHADDRIETVLYRLCRGTGLAGLRGIGWRGPLSLADEPDVSGSLRWVGQASRLSPRSVGFGAATAKERLNAAAAKAPLGPAATCEPEVVRPLLACSRKEILAYLKSKSQDYRTDATNFDARIPRNALRNIVLPILEEKVHPGARGALWRLAEEAEEYARRGTWSREWLAAFAEAGQGASVQLPLPPPGSELTTADLSAALDVLARVWRLERPQFGSRHVRALEGLFAPESGSKRIDLPGGLVAVRRGRTVTLAPAEYAADAEI